MQVHAYSQAQKSSMSREEIYPIQKDFLQLPVPFCSIIFICFFLIVAQHLCIFTIDAYLLPYYRGTIHLKQLTDIRSREAYEEQ